MREIKFRGKRKDNGEWVYGNLIVTEFETGIIQQTVVDLEMVEFDPEIIEVSPQSVGQNTGLKDKNGREIYEGDIVKVLIDGIDEYLKCVVFWDEDRYCWNLKDSTGDDYYDYFSGKTPFEAIEEIEIIGNIYEHKHLLEKKDV